MKQKPDDKLEEQRRWARWHTEARAAYEKESKRLGREIDWWQLPLVDFKDVE